MFAPESLDYLQQKTVVLQSQEAKIIGVMVRNDETIALINLPSEFLAQEFLAKASPTMQLVVLITPHIPIGNDPRLRSDN